MHRLGRSLSVLFYSAYCLGWAIPLAVVPLLHAADTTRPNVLIIYTDDQGSLDLNCYGAKDLATPNLDRLAKQGVRFTQMYAPSAICSASRAGLMTGRIPPRAGVPGNVSSSRGVAGMPTDETTIAEMMKSAGYVTGHIGKWHLGYTPATMPGGQGFDYSYGHMGGCIDNYSHFFYWAGPNRHDLWRNGVEIWEDGHFFPERLADETCQFIEQNRDRPFFVYMANNVPHYPLQGTQKWRDYYANKRLESPRDMYAAFVSTLDEQIGRVIAKVDELGLREKTLIIFQSDHGHSTEERTFYGGGYAGPYRGAKGCLFEGGLRVPSIVSMPGTVPQGVDRDQMAVGTDWLPTIADLCQVPLPRTTIDGRSLRSVIFDNETTPHAEYYWQLGAGNSPQWVVRRGDWKLLGNPRDTSKKERLTKEDSLFLVDLSSDVSETKNVAANHPDVVAEMTDIQKRYTVDVNAPREGNANGAERPNILVVLTDDMGFSDLGCYGGEIETPNLDALAAAGLRFTDFHNTARCWPTRATLMSGIYSSGLSDQQVTIPEVLGDAGYQTGMVGKWHLGGNPKQNGPIQRGFDRFYGTMGGGGSYWTPPGLTRDTEFVDPDGSDFYYTDKIGEEAAKQIEAFANGNAPFFQYVAFTAAHWPIHAPEATIQKYIERYRGGWEGLRKQRYARLLEMEIIAPRRWPLPPIEPGVADWESVEHKAWRVRNMAVYAAMVDHMDQAVGRIVDALKRTDSLDNTLVVYMHDNGACSEHLSGNGWGTAHNVLAWAEENGKTIAMGDQYEVPMGGPLTYGSVGHNWANAQNTPLRRYKANVYEGGACTPCIMHWPAGMRYRGEITCQRGHVVDLMATCIDLAGAEYPKQVDGKSIIPHDSLSLVPVITGGQQPKDHAYYFDHNKTQAVIRGDWKVVRERGGPWRLYQVAENRTETEDLAETHPEMVEQLTSLFDRWAKRNQSMPQPMR